MPDDSKDDEGEWEELEGEFDEAWLTPEGWKDFENDEAEPK